MRLITIEIVRFNSTETMDVEVFPLDTKLSVARRFAYVAGVDPEYLYVPDFDPNSSTRVSVITPWDPVSIWDADPVKFYDKFSPYFTTELIVTLWANFHRVDDLNTMLYTLEVTRPSVADEFTTISFDRMAEYARNEFQREEFQREFYNRIGIFQRKEFEYIQKFRFLESIPEKKLIRENSGKYSISGKIKTNGDLAYIFDHLHATRVFPVIAYSSYYKTHPHYVFTQGWVSLEGRIRIKFSVDKIESEIIIEDSGEDGVFTFRTADLQSDKDLVKQYIRSFLSKFDTSIDRDIPVFTYQNDTRVNIKVLSDILMTIREFEPIFAMNGRRTITSDYSDRRIYFRNAYDEQSKVVFFELTQVGMQTASFTIRDDDPTIRIFLSKLLTVYDDNKRAVINEYIAFGVPIEDADTIANNVGEEKGDEKEEEKGEEKGEPVQRDSDTLEQVLFGARWSSSCQPIERHPVVLTLDEKTRVEQLDIDTLRTVDANGKQPINPSKRRIPLTDADQLRRKYRDAQIMQFPRNEDVYLVCVNPAYPYPGIIENKNSELGYQPCCFKTDKRRSKHYRAYYDGVATASKESTYVITKDKIITKGVLGEFSPVTRQYDNLITKCFQDATRNSDMKIVRYGILHTPNSFLECVLVALGLPTNDLEGERRSLLNDIHPNLLRQEMFAFTEDEIRDYIQNTDTFFNPLYTIRLVEYKYKCRIMIFRRDEMYPEGTLSLPHHTRGYMRVRPDTDLPTIMVYMHIGTDSDNISFPHCELLAHVPNNVNTTKKVDDIKGAFVFTDNNPVSRFCWNLYNEMGYEQGSRDTLDLEPLNEDDIKGQDIDEYGKMRFILVRLDGKDVVLETPPYPPINRETVDITKFLAEEELNARDQNYSVVTYSGIPMRLYSERVLSRAYSTSESNEKLSRYLTEWSLFKFSQFLDNNGIKSGRDLTAQKMEEFVAQVFQIRDNYVYSTDTEALFEEEYAGNLIQSGQIVCSSIEMRNRLVFRMWSELVRREDATLSYKDNNMMKTYYKSVLDFTAKRENLFVYDQGLESSFRRVVSTSDAYPLYTYPQNLIQYFLRHPAVESGKLVRIHNYDTIEKIAPMGFDEPSLLVYIFEGNMSVNIARTIEHPDIAPKRILITRFENTILFGKIQPI